MTCCMRPISGLSVSIAAGANPQAYLLRMALNAAADDERGEKRVLAAVEIDDLWRLGDDTLDPETIAVGRSELALFKAALSELHAAQPSDPENRGPALLPHEVIPRGGRVSRDFQHRIPQHRVRKGDHHFRHGAAQRTRDITRPISANF